MKFRQRRHLSHHPTSHLLFNDNLECPLPWQRMSVEQALRVA